MFAHATPCRYARCKMPTRHDPQLHARPCLATMFCALAALLLRGPAAPTAPLDPPRVQQAPEFVNSLEMRFRRIASTPDGHEIWFCIWPTRVRDYAAFAKATGREIRRPGFSQTGEHPVVLVNWVDAVSFCRWLTAKERAAGLLPDGAAYRLSTRAEWNIAAGASTPPAIASSPVQTPRFPWGGDWPPPAGSGNYHPDIGADPYPNTSPVTAFPPNANGLHDTSGNVWQWCQDPFANTLDFRVLKGGSWRISSPGDLLLGAEIGNTSSLRLDSYGFRIVREVPTPGTPQARR